jgi:hypothetical protein
MGNPQRRRVGADGGEGAAICVACAATTCSDMAEDEGAVTVDAATMSSAWTSRRCPCWRISWRRRRAWRPCTAAWMRTAADA